MKIKVQRLEKLQQILSKLPPKAWTALEAGILELAGEIMNEAQTRVPVVTGRLRSSAYVRKQKRNKYRNDITLGYEAPYAVYVHEIPYSGRTTKGLPGALRNGKGYKWVAKSVDKVLRGARVRLINMVRSALGKR